MRNAFHGIADVAGGLLGVALGLSLLALWAGGISYRKECDDSGVIKEDWKVTWYAPIPYVFRPDDPRCVVHTGTRVALASVGIAEFEPTTPELIAKRAASKATSRDNAYFVRLRAIMTGFFKRTEKSTSIFEGQVILRDTRSKLSKLKPTMRYASLQRRLDRVLARQQRTSEKLRVAIESGDRSVYHERLSGELLAEAKETHRILLEYNRLHAAD